MRSSRRRKTHHNILESTTTLFAAHGITSTTTADIAKAAGLSHGGVFVHFETRDALITAVVDRFILIVSDAFEHQLPERRGFYDILTAYLAALSPWEDFYFRILTEMHMLPAGTRDRIFDMNVKASKHLYAAALPEMQKGCIKNLSRPQFFNTWAALVGYYVMNRAQLSTGFPILREKEKDIADHIMALLDSV